MTTMNESKKRFGFVQFRFVIAGVLLIAAMLKAYQLTTAPLPPVVQGSMFTPLLELFNDRYFLMVTVVGEILFALVLIAGIWLQYTWLLSLLGFTAFTLISMMKGLSGESSCGCFGTATVNPWITVILDLLIVACLVVFRERLDWRFPTLDRKKVLAVLVVWLVLAIPTMFAMLSLKQQPLGILGTELEGFDGRRMIHLEPEKWIGKEFPLIAWFTELKGTEVLLVGAWNVLLVQPGCDKCQEMMKDLEKKKPEKVAFVILSSQSGENVMQTSFPTFVLDKRIDWFADTPLMVKLSDGICVAAGGTGYGMNSKRRY